MAMVYPVKWNMYLKLLFLAYSLVPNISGGPNKDFFVYYMKNRGEGGQIFRLLHEKQG